MAYEPNIVPGDGSTTDFSVPFPYLRREHVKVYVDGVLTAHSWVNGSVVRVSPAPASGSEVSVRRDTPTAAIHTLQNNLPLPAKNFNELTSQAIYFADEKVRAAVEERERAEAAAAWLEEAFGDAEAARDAAQAYAAAADADRVQTGLDRAAVAADKAAVQGLAAATAADAAATAADRVQTGLDKTAAAGSATAAAGSASAAGTHASNAAASASAAAADRVQTGLDRAAVAADRTAAQTARTGSEAARDAAQAARDDAEDAAAIATTKAAEAAASAASAEGVSASDDVAWTGLHTFSQRVKIGDPSTPNVPLTISGSVGGADGSFHVYNTLASTYVGGFQFYAPNMVAGQEAYCTIGKVASLRNRVALIYRHAGDSSLNNYFSIGFYGTSNLLNVLASGDVGVGTTAPTAKLHVTGTIRMGSYTLATTPNWATVGAGTLAYITDAVGGPTVAFSTGAVWKFLATRDEVQSGLDGKADTGHTHTIAQVAGLQAALDDKSPSVHGHAAATPSASGFMSAADKTKLDAVGTMANRTLTISTSDPSGGVNGDVWFKV